MVHVLRYSSGGRFHVNVRTYWNNLQLIYMKRCTAGTTFNSSCGCQEVILVLLEFVT